MATIDDKVVAASFESSKFEQGVSKTIGSIDKLKKALVFPNAGKGFTDIEKASQSVDLSHIGKSVDQIKSKFSAFNAVATATLFRLTNVAITTGSQIVKSLTLDPVMAGFHNYETQINAVQTILANTGLTGKKGLDKVTASLNDLNEYANKTVYNFSEMAKNIGTFTAAGVDLKTATGSIKGIANLAALSGSNSQQASTAMYQLSQAIAAGKVSLQDWNSVVNAGMGGKVFQKALADTAQAMGTLKDGSVKLVGPMKQLQINGESFRAAIQAKPGTKSWLTSDVLTKTLEHFTGDMTDAQLAAQGFNKEQIKAIQAQAKTAVGAATNIKTLTQMMDALKEEVASAWGAVFKTLFGDINGATNLFSGMHNVLQNMLTGPIMSFNKVLEHWAKMGGQKSFIHSLTVGFHDLQAVLKPIKDAFREIFPAKTGRDLINATKSFHHLVSILSPTKDTINNLHRTFKGLFALLDIGKQIVSGVFSVIKQLVGQVGKSSGGVLNFTGNVGDLIVKFDEWLKSGNRLKDFFNKIGSALAVPISMVSNFANAVLDLINGTNKIKGVSDAFGSVGDALSPSEQVVKTATDAWQGFLDVLKNVYNVVQPLLSAIGSAFAGIGNAIADAIKHQNFDNVFAVIQTGLIAGIFLELKKALTGGLNFDLGGKALKNVAASLDVLKGSLAAMQQTIRAAALVEIASAVALLTASVVALTFVDPKKLSSAMTAITIGLGQLVAAVALLQKSGGGSAKLAAASASMILLAGALDVLSIAIIAMSKLSWEELGRGMAGIAASLALLSAASITLSKSGPRMAIAAASLIPLAIGLTILGGAVKIFATINWSDLGRGLAGLTLALTAIAVTTQAMPPTLPLIGAGLILVGTGVAAIGGALKIFASIKWSDLTKGMEAMAVALGVIALTMEAMPPTLPLTAAGLILVGVALTGIAGAIALMGQMNVGTLAKGIGGIATALLALAVGLTAMIASLPGAAALLVAAAGLAILVPLIGIMGNMKFSTVAKGLGLIVLSMAALGAAGAVAAPGLIALGVALTALSVGIALAGAGIYLLTSGLAKLAGPGAKGIGVAIAALTAFVAILPKIIIDFVKGLVEILASIAKIAPQVVDSLVKIAESLVEVVIRVAPKMAVAAIALITAILKVLNSKAGAIIQAGWKLLLNLLKGINDHIVEATKMMATIVAKMIGALASKAGELISAGYTLLIQILKGIANNFGRVIAAGVQIVAKLISGIISNIGKVVTAILKIVAKIISTIAEAAKRFISTGAKIIANIVTGIGNAASAIVTAALKTVTKFITTITTQIPKEVDKIATAVIRMINAMADVVRRREKEFIDAVSNLGVAIVQGLIDGIWSQGKKLANSIISFAKKFIPGPVRKALGIHSPSKVMMEVGENIVNGIIVGMNGQGPALSSAAETMANDMVATMAKTTRKKVVLTFGKMQNDILDSIFKPGVGNPRHDFFNLLTGQTDRNDQVDQAMNSIKDKIKTGIADTRKNISDETKTIKSATDKMNGYVKRNTDLVNKRFVDQERLRAAAKAGHKQSVKQIKEEIAKDDEAIAENNKKYKAQRDISIKAQKQRALNTVLLGTLLDTQKTVNKGLDDEQAKLRDNIAQYEEYSKKIDEAKQSLADLIQEKKDFVKQKFDEFSALPDIVGTDAKGHPLGGAQQVKNYISGLNKSADATTKFMSTLDTLRGPNGEGLNADTYKQLLDIGPAAQGFADALLQMGPDAINAVNSADTGLKNAAQAMADHAGARLYDAGIAIDQGLVDGLQADQDKIMTEMEKIANGMIKIIKDHLHIKSPSKVFAEIGRYSALGLAKGLNDSSTVVTDAVYGITDDALSALKSGMAGISDEVAKQIDPNPTITPVLDLSQIKAGVREMGGIIGAPVASASLANASAISTNPKQVEDVAAPGGTVLKFEQNNYSPESLSAIEIYRQTRNQFSQAKAALGS